MTGQTQQKIELKEIIDKIDLPIDYGSVKIVIQAGQVCWWTVEKTEKPD